MCERPKTIVRETEDSDAREHLGTDVLRDRSPGERDRDDRCADAGRRAQPAEAVRPYMQNVARICGQQRRRAAEEHGEQVERHGAEDDLPPPHEADALEQRMPGIRFGSARRFLRASHRRSGQTPRRAAPRPWRRRRPGPARYTIPPIAGPAMVETCHVLELTATAREKNDGGTRFGMIAWPAGIENARAVPKMTITAKTGQATARPESVKASSSSAQTNSSAMQSDRISARLCRSATCPAGSTSRTNGRNCDRPIRPRSSGSRVIA